LVICNILSNIIDKNLSLVSKEFSSDSANTLRDLIKDKCFTDVTLVSEDNIQRNLHKVILSASSPFFRNILMKNPNSNPLLFIKGVKDAQLQSIINFVYLGETEVAHKDIDIFLATARDLQIKGLSEETQHSIDLLEPEESTEEEKSQYTFAIENTIDYEQTTLIKEETNRTTNRENPSDLKVSAEPTPLQSFLCEMCDGLFDEKIDLKKHQKETHISIVENQSCAQHHTPYHCDECGKSFTQKSKIKRHMNEVHSGITYKCDSCRFETSRKEYLKIHKEKHH
jgi:predicted RNA-binding Zn-ribbon protein involved in translation (DUF1610 family)